MTKPNIAVFASGSGTNYQALMDAIAAGDLQAHIALLVCDREEAAVLEKAAQDGTPTFVFSAKAYEHKAAFEQEIVNQLRAFDVQWLVLAGYMRLVGATLLAAYPHHIVNIHPSLLPSFPGKDAIGQALQADVKRSGVTVHYVDEGMDTGEIIAQQAVPVYRDDGYEQLQERIQRVEHLLYPEVVHTLLHGD